MFTKYNLMKYPHIPGVCFKDHTVDEGNYRHYLDFCTAVHVLVNSRIKGKAIRRCEWSTPVVDFVTHLNIINEHGITFYSRPLGRKTHRKITRIIAAVNRARSASNSIALEAVEAGLANNASLLRYHLSNINAVHNVQEVADSALGVALQMGPDGFVSMYNMGYRFAKISIPKRYKAKLQAAIDAQVLNHHHRQVLKTAIMMTDFHD